MKYLSKIDVSIVCFIAFVVRLVIFGASVGDAIALVSMAAIFSFEKWLKYQDVKKYNETFENAVKAEFERANAELQKVRSQVSSLNLGSTFVGNRFSNIRPDGQ